MARTQRFSQGARQCGLRLDLRLFARERNVPRIRGADRKSADRRTGLRLDGPHRINEGIDTTAITEMANFFRTKIKYNIPANYPFVGADFNTTRAGIHADGLTKNEGNLQYFDTEKFLRRPCRVAVSNTSGLAGIAYWIQENIPAGTNIRKDNRESWRSATGSMPNTQKEEPPPSAMRDAPACRSLSSGTCERVRKHDPGSFCSVRREETDLAPFAVKTASRRDGAGRR